jgi:hypothetical protein
MHVERERERERENIKMYLITAKYNNDSSTTGL